VETTAPECPRCGLAVSREAEFCEHCGAPLAEARPAPWWHLHRRIYDWTLAWAYRPSAAWALGTLSFAESSFFPVPPDVLLMPLVLGNRRKWFRYALICSIASVLGAIAGFLIGWLAWEGGVDRLFFDYVPGFTPEVYNRMSAAYERYNFWIVFTAGFTPIPFKVITITAGVFGTGGEVGHPGLFFSVFVLAATVSRSARFFLVAGLMRLYGAKITPFIDRYFNWLALLFVALLIGGVLAGKYLF
jgi:membrane protein YqaA with SNARE-associated domain